MLRGHSEVIAAFLICCCCGGSNPTAPPTEITEAGWVFFQQGYLEDAVSKFSEALGVNSNWADAHNGRGWSFLELRRFDDAANDLQAVLSLTGGQGQIANEARTALGSVQNTAGDYESSSQNLRAVISSDPAFRFSRRATVDIVDVRLLLSTALLGLSEDETDPDVVDSYFDEIASNLNAIDTENPVYRDDPNSWKLGVNRYNSFEETILEKLEWLINIYYG